MEMKKITIRDMDTGKEVALSLSNESSITDMWTNWLSSRNGKHGEYVFRSNDGKPLEHDMKVKDIPVSDNGSKSINVTAERICSVSLEIFGPKETSTLVLSLPLSVQVSLLSVAVIQSLSLADKCEFEYRLSSKSVPLKLSKSLRAQGIGDKTVIECDFCANFLILSDWEIPTNVSLSSPISGSGSSDSSCLSSLQTKGRSITLRGRSCLSEVLDPSLSSDQQQLLFNEQPLDVTNDVRTELGDELDRLLAHTPKSSSLCLRLQRKIPVQIHGGPIGSVEAMGWSGQSVSSWLNEVLPQAPDRPVWHEDKEVSVDTTKLGSLHQEMPLSQSVILFMDKVRQLTLVTNSGAVHHLRIRHGATVNSLLRRLVRVGWAKQNDRLEFEDCLLETGDRTLQSYGVRHQSTIQVRSDGLDLRLELEGQDHLVAGVPAEAPFAVILRRAASAFGCPLPGDTVFLCGCGRRLEKGTFLARQCCFGTSPRSLIIRRPISVSVVSMGTQRQLVRLRLPSTVTAKEVMTEFYREKGPEVLKNNNSKWRFRTQDGSVLNDDQPLYTFCPAVQDTEEGDVEDLRLILEYCCSISVLILSTPNRRVLWRAWPSDILSDTLKALHKAKHLNSGPSEGMKVKLRGLVLKPEMSLKENGIRNCDTITVKSPLCASPSEKVETRTRISRPVSTSSIASASNVESSKISSVKRTWVRVICRNYGVPDFEMELAVPVSAMVLRKHISVAFYKPWFKVFLLQHRAYSSDNRLLVDIGGYMFADTDGKTYPREIVQKIHKHYLKVDGETLPIPGNKMWKVFIQSVI